jgi:hypothetical protein
MFKMYTDKLNSLSFEEIQKYNGKSVKPIDLTNFVLNDTNVIVAFKTKSIRASDEIKLRAFLKKFRIFVKRFKTRNIPFFERFITYPLEKKLVFLNFLKFMEGSGVLFIFEDFSHYFFFEKHLTLRIEKFKFYPIMLKSNDQYIFANSVAWNSNMDLIKQNTFDMNRLISFNFFQLMVVRNFLYFFIFFRFQLVLYNRVP